MSVTAAEGFVAAGCHAAMIVVLAGLYLRTAEFGLVFLIGLIAITLLLAYEHWLVRPNDLSRVNRAFFQVNVLVSVGLFLLVLAELALKT